MSCFLLKTYWYVQLGLWSERIYNMRTPSLAIYESNLVTDVKVDWGYYLYQD